MIQRYNAYGWVVEAICLGLLLGTIVAGGFYVAQRELWPDAPMRVLSSVEAIERGWPAQWGE